jgi:hypothetical protein
MSGASPTPTYRQPPARYQMQKGSERKRLGPSYVSWHAVTRRLTCLIVVPALVIARVTPLPE